MPIQFKSKMNKFLWASEVNQLSQNHYTSLADKKQTKQFITLTGNQIKIVWQHYFMGEILAIFDFKPLFH